MADITVDNLSLDISGISEEDALRLARLIADGLAASSVRGWGGQVDSVESRTESRPGETPESLSARIVDEVIRAAVRNL